MGEVIEVYSIGSTQKAVTGDYYQVHSMRNPPSVIVPSGNPATFLDETFEILTSRIERVSFVDQYQNRTDEYFTIDPRHQKKILMLVEQCEINRLKRAKQQLENWYGKEQDKNKRIVNTNLLTRIKWLFTGVKLEQGVNK